LDYLKLYDLQDKVLKKVFETTKSFYLTGGTALHRFYYDIRYSDVLDFFCIDEYFAYEIREIINNLKNEFSVEVEVDARFFKLLYVNGLKVDFVDTHFEPHFGNFLKQKDLVIDSKENIFVNKITAIMGRDEEKDIADFYFLKTIENYNLKEYLEKAKEKSIFETEDFLFRLNTFPLEKIKNVHFKKESYLNEIFNNYKEFVKNIQKEVL
jgi:predicted nucleotidyltransferase component of viral defense system